MRLRSGYLHIPHEKKFKEEKYKKTQKGHRCFHAYVFVRMFKKWMHRCAKCGKLMSVIIVTLAVTSASEAQSSKVKVNIVEVAEYQQRSLVGYAMSDKKSKVIENKHGIHAMFHRETDMERRERMARRVAR